MRTDTLLHCWRRQKFALVLLRMFLKLEGGSSKRFGIRQRGERFLRTMAWLVNPRIMQRVPKWRTIYRCFFEKIQQYAEPRATKVVRQVTGTGLREGDNTIDLPSFMSKRSLHRLFCWERGHQLGTDAMGKVTATPRNDEEWVSEPRQTHEIVSWKTFLRFWGKNFPNLVIRPPKKTSAGCATHSYRRINRILILMNNKTTTIVLLQSRHRRLCLVI